MTDELGANEARTTPSPDDADPRLLDPRVRPWMEEHLAEMRRSVAEHRFRSQVLWTGLVAGLAAHVAGYLLRASAPNDLLGLLADLLYTLGFAMWTGVVVVLMVEIISRESRNARSSVRSTRTRPRSATGRMPPPGRNPTPAGSAATQRTPGLTGGQSPHPLATYRSPDAARKRGGRLDGGRLAGPKLTSRSMSACAPALSGR